jgi:hypothetical protein
VGHSHSLTVCPSLRLCVCVSLCALCGGGKGNGRGTQLCACKHAFARMHREGDGAPAEPGTCAHTLTRCPHAPAHRASHCRARHCHHARHHGAPWCMTRRRARHGQARHARAPHGIHAHPCAREQQHGCCEAHSTARHHGASRHAMERTRHAIRDHRRHAITRCKRALSVCEAQQAQQARHGAQHNTPSWIKQARHHRAAQQHAPCPRHHDTSARFE